VEQQLPKLYVVGSIPIARSKFFKQFRALSAVMLGNRMEQNGTFGSKARRFGTKSPEKVPNYVPLSFGTE
jgi:hypothetical protein